MQPTVYNKNATTHSHARNYKYDQFDAQPLMSVKKHSADFAHFQ